MPKKIAPLTDPKCEAARPADKDYSLFDGNGLHLLVKRTGLKVWRYKFKRPSGKQGLMTFGRYPSTRLKTARQKRDDAAELLAAGIDPIDHKKAEQAAKSGALTFEAVTRDWHRSQVARDKWSGPHAERVIREMEANLFQMIGRVGIEDFKTRDLLAPLRAVETRGALDMAARLQQRICSVFRYAVQNGLIDYNPAQDLTGAVKTRKAKHRPALPLERLGELQNKIHEYTGRPLTRLAMLMTLHVFIRSSELRFARWSEIDWKRKLWIIPPEREAIEGVPHSTRGSKMRDTHLVPLSPAALQLLEEIQTLSGRSALIFPSDSNNGRPMSENTINKALRRLGYDTQQDVCGHGFRTMACSALVESGLWSRDAVERQMSHKERNGVRAAYIHKAEHLEERRLMLDWWSKYLEESRREYVAPFEYSQPKGLDVARLRRA
ncbi:tyrosine-type recombinase/integrase [Microbulbifer sp. ARAS458-1]|uniref:tyrosine-type recombinase/integrase n=1 Tax=Microbulbifer sp. ARAS458-1 TaxID=3140242 RepID=UPI003877E8BA